MLEHVCQARAEPDRMDKPGEFPIMILADLVMQVHIRKPSPGWSNSDIGIMNHDSINLICRGVDGCGIELIIFMMNLFLLKKMDL